VVLAGEPGPALAALLATIHLVTIGMVVRGPDCRLLGCNPAYSRMLDYERDELLVLASTNAHPDDQAIGPTWWRRLAAGEVDTYQRKKRYLGKDGSAPWGLITVSAHPITLSPSEPSSVCR
jgi:PAS domain S-box-containing protein